MAVAAGNEAPCAEEVAFVRRAYCRCWDFGEGAKQEIWLVSLSHLPKPEIETPKSEIQNPKTGGRVWLMKE